jgi:hypothetical protein
MGDGGRRKIVAVVAFAALGLAACAPTADIGESEQTPEQTAVGQSVELENVQGSPRLDVPSALDDRENPEFPEPLIDPDSLRSGGPPPDGIPAIDTPKFEKASDIDWLDPNESVLSFTENGETRAYPIQILVWHEIVNDTVGGTPVAVTYCPLCNSAVALDRRVDDLVLTFGTSGLLHNSDLVMYDRQTESLWPQLGFQAAIGHLTGAEPEVLSLSTLPWREFRDENPDSWVLSRDTGFSRDYGGNPYRGYDSDDTSKPFLFDGMADGRLPIKTHVIGLFPRIDPVAITVQHILDEGLVVLDGPDGEVLLWARPDVRSPLDADQVAGGRKTGAAVAFKPETTAGVAVDLERAEAPQESGASKSATPFRDKETGSEFDWSGLAKSGSLKGQRLEQVPAVDTFWFAWAAFSPDTRLVR